MNDLNIRKAGRAGRITFTRPKALNALSHDMALAIHDALDGWRDDAAVELVVIDAEGDRAFCAGGDIAAVYRAGLAGDHATGQRFFADEYRMNAAIADYPKPVVAFMGGFVMGGGVGVGGHASHRIVGDTTQIAMPESGIGLIPDVGGTWLLSRAPGRVGEYLALTGARMGAGDAIHAGFADTYLPETHWPDLIARLEETGDPSLIEGRDAPTAPLRTMDLSPFAQDSVADIIDALEQDGDAQTLKILAGNSPLSMAAGLAMVRAARDDARMQESLAREYRFTYRATRDTDFLEGVRAQIIDKDRKPKWMADASPENVAALLAPLGPHELTLEERA
ncbi:enoyl-CoA hydratase/isomerase family protein [Paracoccus sediminis]|uniref:3-hydroxyisobutyryl-CoA hydrolase n=1 Tax=Paracoccus sediminis TaxID=1214787 RepID=A0A238V054_9RHOB|nr:enoyl-CoA hydratase/isomerase family protein [Paracoccus sediminis]TBN52656.1 enoyl-CoA hydratase/isomerase family protein [Paracoccus sediminis]SNR26909.1 Enoyl-CoA hydratase/carnithine racemase [Paracoccus sediminis]